MTTFIVPAGTDETTSTFIAPGINPGSSESLWAGIRQGASFGWEDEIRALFGGNLEAARAERRRAADANPAGYGTGRLVGAIGTSVLPASWFGWTARAGQGLGAAIRGGATVGGTAGALEALGEHENKTGDPMGAAVSTAIGGGVGAAAGGVLSPALYGLMAGVRGGQRMLSDYTRGGSDAALRKTAEALERQGTDPASLTARLVADARGDVRTMHASKPEVLQAILRGFQEGHTATQVTDAINRRYGLSLSHLNVGKLRAGFDRANQQPRDLLRLSEEAGGGEAGRSGLTGMMQAVASLPGRGREIALRNLGRGMEEAPERMVTSLARETGTDANFRGALIERQTARAQEAEQLYNAAYQQGTAGPIAAALGGTGSRQISGLLQPILTQHTMRAVNLGGERLGHMRRALEIMSGAARSPGPGQLGVQTIRDFHQARQELDQLLLSLRRSPAPADRDAARIIGGMREEMNSAVHKAYPRFAEADRRYASAIAREEAMDLGREYTLRLGTKQDDIIKQMRTLELRHPGNAAELREYMMMGIMRNMADEIARSGGMPTNWIRPLTGGVRPAQQQALEAVLAAPLPGAAIAGRGSKRTGAVMGEPVPHGPGLQMSREITEVLSSEARLRKIFTDVFGNSNTAGKLAAMEDLRQLPQIAAEMATGGWISGLRSAIANRLATAIRERNSEQIARIVTETDPRQLYIALQEIQRMLPMMRSGERTMAMAAIAMASGIGQQVTGP